MQSISGNLGYFTVAWASVHFTPGVFNRKSRVTLYSVTRKYLVEAQLEPELLYCELEPFYALSIAELAQLE